ncbi:MAG TPA: enoyl-CoA hydratase/isomerase family protein [Allosphingosinicella sp.]|nr:enoyl-CoA hydratase/isomerase family protein [Allosphingosinicella sp.]
MSDLLVSKADAVTTLTLNRPERRNALCAELVDRLQNEVDKCREDGTRLLVLRGEGRNFSAGFDLTGFMELEEAALVLRFIRIEQLLQSLYRAPFETLAFAHGANFGAGADLFCACARRIAAPDASFGMPGLRFGLFLGTRRLAQRIGSDAARRLLVSTRRFGSEEALVLDFIQEIRERDRLPDAIAEAAREAKLLLPAVQSHLFSMLSPNTDDSDLADLVRSASRPGLKDRISRYVAESEGPRSRIGG